MRKILCQCLVLTLCLCLCSCKSSDYKKAMSLYEAGEYEQAIAAFEALADYKDSVQKIDECKYGAAVALMESGNYEEAIAAFEAMGEYKDCPQKIEACKTAILDIRYDEAIALMDGTDVVAAYEALAALCGHKDSNKKAASLYDEYFAVKSKSLRDGDIFYFGSYEQDNNRANGKEPIGWIVIDDSSLLISQYGLDCYPFNWRDNWVWECSDILEWLNTSFLDSAFTEHEQSRLFSWNDGLGDFRHYKVSLLSAEEVETRLSDQEAIGESTAYVRAQNGTVEGSAWWWTRTDKILHKGYAESVLQGKISGAKMNADMIAVRPLIMLNLG